MKSTGTRYYVEVRFGGEKNARTVIDCDSDAQAEAIRAALDEIDWIRPTVLAWDVYPDQPLPRLTRDELTQIITSAARNEYEFAADPKDLS